MFLNLYAIFFIHVNNTKLMSFKQTNQEFMTQENFSYFEFFNKYLHLHNESLQYLDIILYLNKNLYKQQYLDVLTFVTV